MVGAKQTNRWIVLAVLCTSLFVVALDATVLYVAVPMLTADLRPTPVELLWIIDVYALVIAGVLVTSGALGDRYGRQKMLVGGFAVFAVASTLAALAASPAMLVGARVLLGLGGAMIMPPTLSIIRQVFPDHRERSVAIGVWSATASAGAAIGPVVGGLLLEHFWWGSVFLINVPIMLVAIPIGIWLLPDSRSPDPGPLDALSAVLSIVGIMAVVYAIKKIGYYGPLAPVVFGPALAGLALLVFFVRRQLRLPRPLLDVRLFTNRAFSAAAGCAVLSMFGLAGAEMFIVQSFQYVDGDSPLRAGLRILPLAVAAMFAAPFAGRIIHRFGMRVAIVGGFALVAIGLWAFGRLGATGGAVAVAAMLVAIGAGAAIALTASSDTIMAVAPPEKAGAAAAVDEVAYDLGIGLGVATLGSLMADVYGRAVPAVPGVSAALLERARSSIAEARQVRAELPADVADRLLTAARDAFTHGLSVTLAIAAVVLALAAAISFALLPRGAPPEH